MPLRQWPIGTLLDLVFGNSRVPGGGPRWSPFRRGPTSATTAIPTRADTSSPPGLTAPPRTTPDSCANHYERRHDFDDGGLDMDDQERVHAAVRRHVNGPGAAVTWDIQRQKLQIVRAPQIDWRKA